jgi:predicted Fe-S protein YdhL (DUF1289 family)
VNAATKPDAPVVPSPCVDVRRMDPATGWCLGCARTIEEIAAWASLDNGGKRRVWKLLPARREVLAQRGQEGTP